MTDCNDDILIQRIKQGDEEAFKILVDKYKNRALGIVFNFIPNLDDAKELAQDAFVKVYYSISRFKGHSSFFTWFYRILINTCLDHRKKRRFRGIPFSQIKATDTTGRFSAEEIIEDNKTVNPLKKIMAQELNQRIRQAVDSLSEKQKLVFILRNYEHLSLSEIAVLINCAEGTVKSHLARAVRRLQELLSPIPQVTESENGSEQDEQMQKV